MPLASRSKCRDKQPVPKINHRKKNQQQTLSIVFHSYIRVVYFSFHLNILSLFGVHVKVQVQITFHNLLFSLSFSLFRFWWATDAPLRCGDCLFLRLILIRFNLRICRVGDNEEGCRFVKQSNETISYADCDAKWKLNSMNVCACVGEDDDSHTTFASLSFVTPTIIVCRHRETESNLNTHSH